MSQFISTIVTANVRIVVKEMTANVLYLMQQLVDDLFKKNLFKQMLI